MTKCPYTAFERLYSEAAYGEVAKVVERVKTEASGLLRAAAAAGVGRVACRFE
jgi:hypothetical protein